MYIKSSNKLTSIHRKTKPPIALYTKDEWVQSADYIEWIYTDIDKQVQVIIEYKNINKPVVQEKVITTENKYVLISDLGLTDTGNFDGIYEWRIKALGSEANLYSDYSEKVQFRLDNLNPELEAVDIVNIVNLVEYHSNYKEYNFENDMQNAVDNSNPQIFDGVYISNNDDLNLCKIRFKSTANQKRKFQIKIMIPKNDIPQNLEMNELFKQSIFVSDSNIKIS